MKLGEIARALGAELRDGDPDVEITGVAPIDEASAGTLTFLADRRLEAHLATTRASAILLDAAAPAVSVASLRVPHAYLAFVQALELFHPPARPEPGVHASATIAETAAIGAGAFVGPHVVIGEGVRIGRDAVVHANVTIYSGVVIGDGFVAHAGVVIREGVVIGHRVTLHAGAVIGSDGFGFVPLPGGHRKIPQVGTVTLQDDVEVGANSTIDRAMMGTTLIGQGTKIDNLVMIAHGCRIGTHSLLAAQVGLAGSTIVGSGVMMGGQVGASGHISIGDGSQIAAQAGVHNNLAPGGVYGGHPAMEMRRWRRVTGVFPRLPEVFRRLRRLEKRLGVDAADDDAS
jgi:UDP-3-O-[3-hydroxymyristoyl] glucosamine N-acyltransferase